MSDVVALTYDTLPAESNLRREIDEHGNLRISMAAGEPGTLARRSAMYATAWVSVIWSTAITALLASFVAPMFFANRAQTRSLETLLMMMAGVFFSAMFLLVWWLEYRKRMDAIERASLQATVVSIARGTGCAMYVETVGPFGKSSETIAAPFDLFCRRMPITRAESLHVVPRVGKDLYLFPGLSHTELRWIAAEIRNAMSGPSPSGRG